jgi:hypothetical protein
MIRSFQATLEIKIEVLNLKEGAVMKANKAIFKISGNGWLVLLCSLMLTTPGAAMAADAPASPHTLTANVGFTTDYIFRGISQTSTNPAVQGGVDYSHSSGLYAGVWGSRKLDRRQRRGGVRQRHYGAGHLFRHPQQLFRGFYL